MKKFVALALSLAMVMSLTACGGSAPAPAAAPAAPAESAAPAAEAAAPAEAAPADASGAPAIDWPKGNIEIIVPFKAGGAMDLSARLTATYLKKYLGTEVTINNVEGGANWVGYMQILGAKGDGYTLGFANYPGQVGGYLNPSNNIDVTYESFTNIADIVHDAGIIVVKEDSPYQTLADLLEAAKTEKLIVSTGGGAGSDDDVLVRKINLALGTQLVPGGNENDAEAKNALLGGEADAQACNVSNYCKTYTSTGQTDSVRVLAVFDAEKQALMPDIPTIDEAGIDELKGMYSSSDRGLVACKDLDPEVLAKIVWALEQTQNDPEFIAEATEMGMGINMLFGDDFNAYIKGVEDTLKSMLADFGWQ
ncbi:MAG: tripartite tricarboxylate transporter substrate binding protein [Lachnospiraceae bacterium]|nr:tripartite tricarboxylate transporter substrate binding protein [Lachnospiraceae bacterium]